MSLCIILKKFQIKMIIYWNYIFNVPGRSSEKLQELIVRQEHANAE